MIITHAFCGLHAHNALEETSIMHAGYFRLATLVQYVPLPVVKSTPVVTAPTRSLLFVNGSVQTCAVLSITVLLLLPKPTS